MHRGQFAASRGRRLRDRAAESWGVLRLEAGPYPAALAPAAGAAGRGPPLPLQPGVGPHAAQRPYLNRFRFAPEKCLAGAKCKLIRLQPTFLENVFDAGAAVEHGPEGALDFRFGLCLKRPSEAEFERIGNFGDALAD